MALALILVVDDDALSRELVSELLEVKGYTVLTSTCAEEALSLVEEARPDLVLMDIRLPGLDGLAATRILKEDPVTRDIPVVATTALAMNGDEERILEAGCEAHLVKPLDLSRLLSTVSEFLGPGETAPVYTGGTEARPESIKRGRRPLHDQAASGIRVYLVEDHTLLRESLRAMLELEAEIEVVGEAQNAEQALWELETLDVDVVLMDIRLPDMDGIEATRLLRKQYEAPDVVMLTSYSDEYLGAAVEAGAAGYILKSCTRQQLVEAVRAASHGQAPIDPSLIGSLVRELTELRKVYRESLLTPRQVEILKLVANGSRYKEIASALFMNERTVHREMRSVFDRLGVNDAPHAVSEAYKKRLI